MKIAIFYFSGSGHTELCVKKWKSEAEAINIPTDIFRIEKTNLEEIDFSQYDKVGIAYPVHAFNAPKNVWKFAKRINKMDEKKPLFVIMCSGEYLSLNHSSANKTRRILKRRNFVFESEYHYVMPYNLIFRHTEKRALQMYEVMNKIVPIDVKEYLVDNNPHKLKHLHFVGWFIFLIRIEQPFAPVNGKLFRVKKDKCIKCMKCVNTCPKNNIEFKNGKIKFHNHCVMCTRCCFNCPTDAIRIGILNSWRVNKPYAFKPLEIEEKDRHPRYCKRAYIRYFDEAAKRIDNASNIQ